MEFPFLRHKFEVYALTRSNTGHTILQEQTLELRRGGGGKDFQESREEKLESITKFSFC